MSLELSNSDPVVEVKTYGERPEVVHITGGGIALDIPVLDYLAMAWYVLTNSDLYEDDPRTAFVDVVKRLQQVEGHVPGGKRLAVDKNTWSLVYPPLRLQR